MEMEKVQTILDGLYTDWKWGEITHERYSRIKEKFENQVEVLASAIANLREEKITYGLGIQSDGELFTEFMKHRNVQKLDRSLLIELVDKIYVHENKEITIVFRFADELARIVEFVELNSKKTSREIPNIFLPTVADK